MTNLPDPLEKRMLTDLPHQLDQAVRPFDAAAIARVATVEGRPSILRVIGATAAVAIVAVTAVVAVETLSGARNQLAPGGASPSPTSTAPYSTSASATEGPTDRAALEAEAAVKAALEAAKAAREAAEAALEAAELFEQTDTCATVLADHDTVITFPDQWSTNREAPDGGVPCLWFGPAPVEVVAGAEGPPAGAAITMGAVGGPPGEPSRSADVVTENVGVAGRPALRVEERGTGDGGGELRRVTYWVSVGVDAAGGPTLVATTSSADPGSYELNAAVLDEMMRRLEIREPEGP